MSIVRGTTNGPYTDENGTILEGPHEGIIMSPRQVDANDGDTIRLCNKTNVQSSLFTGSRYNTFGGGLTGAPGSGVRLLVGACTSVPMHNPTSKPITVEVLSELGSGGNDLGTPKLFVTVAPAAGGAVATKVELAPGVSTAQITPLPVTAAGYDVRVTISGLLVQVVASGPGKGCKVCYDAFYYNTGDNWKGNGVNNWIWVGPPAGKARSPGQVRSAR